MIAFASVSAQKQIVENQLIDSPASIVTTKSKIDNEKGSSCPCQPTYDYNSFEFNTLAAINDYRQSINLSELLLIDHISNVAAEHTSYMISVGIASHDNLGVRYANLDCVLDVNEKGENVAYAFNNATSLLNAWLNSPSHRNTIEGNYSHFGISIQKSPTNNAYFITNMFVNNPSGGCATTTPIETCFDEFVIDDNVTPNQTDIQDASVTITATNKIFNTAHAEYDAGTAVILNPGFEALENSTFEAYIEGCSNTLAPSTNNTSTNKSEFGNSFNVSLAPNPSQGAFKVKIDKDLKTINYSLYDFSGNTIVSDSLENTNSFTINKNGLPKGIYLLKIESNEGVMTKKVIIN